MYASDNPSEKDGMAMCAKPILNLRSLMAVGKASQRKGAA